MVFCSIASEWLLALVLCLLLLCCFYYDLVSCVLLFICGLDVCDFWGVCGLFVYLLVMCFCCLLLVQLGGGFGRVCWRRMFGCCLLLLLDDVWLLCYCFFGSLFGLVLVCFPCFLWFCSCYVLVTVVSIANFGLFECCFACGNSVVYWLFCFNVSGLVVLF